MTEAEKNQLKIYREMGTLSQSQALDYHELLNKEYDEDMKPTVTASEPIEPILFEAEATPKKRGRKKKA